MGILGGRIYPYIDKGTLITSFILGFGGLLRGEFAVERWGGSIVRGFVLGL